MLLDLRRRSVPINPSRVGNIVSQRCISCAAPTECHRWAWPARNVLGALTRPTARDETTYHGGRRAVSPPRGPAAAQQGDGLRHPHADQQPGEKVALRRAKDGVYRVRTVKPKGCERPSQAGDRLS